MSDKVNSWWKPEKDYDPARTPKCIKCGDTGIYHYHSEQDAATSEERLMECPYCPARVVRAAAPDLLAALTWFVRDHGNCGCDGCRAVEKAGGAA